VEAVREFAASPNAKTIFMPVEMASLVGTVGGIGELVKAVREEARPPASVPRTSTAKRAGEIEAD
jgi:hypothetical protein